MKQLVSVIVVNYNTFQMTCDCIRSIYEKTLDCESIEVILVDNGSTDADPCLFAQKFPELKVVVSDRNLGFAGGNNLGIRVATGAFILLLNSDTILVNDAIAISRDFLAKRPSAGVVSCKLVFPNGEVQPVTGRFPSIWRELMTLSRVTSFYSKERRAEYYLGAAFDHQKELRVDWVWGAFFMFRRELLDGFEGKLLPEDFFMYYEDVLWCYRIKEQGYDVWYSPEGEVVHLMNGSTKSDLSSAFDRYRRSILPNEYKFVVSNFGFLYAKSYYLIKSIGHLSQRTKMNLVKSGVYFRLFLFGQ